MDSATNGHYSEAEVNQKAIRLFEHIHTLESEHASKLTSIAETQRREYRYYLGDLHEKHLLGKLKVDPSPERHRAGSTADGQPLDSKGFEESFTIHLGAQMKTMHNVRLAVANPLDLCFSAAKIDEISQKLHMSLNLYTDRLSAVVLFVDSKPTYHIDFRTDFYRACERSTELHFQNLESQLLQIKHDCINANKWRQQQASTSSNSPGQGSSVYERSYDSDDTLKTGDVYITRHSNLSSVNVVFHMVSDDETLRTQEINSRHPCLNALRNIIRICMRFGITTINLPLLLVNEFTQEMNVSWCAKRAELVFKCVKGFMIEGGNLKSNTQYNVQFLLPLGTPANIFWHMSEMLPTIFRLANPVVMASTTQAR